MNTQLPIFPFNGEIISAVDKYDTVILTAETGSGKSTQVPQYLYNAGYNVIVTQPRRIACVSLADRVSKEMLSTNNLVAYQTAFESTRDENTRILFCTDGLQLARGITDSSKSILVIDELHEWNLNIETLVAWIKKYRNDGGNLKIVLMSATMDVESLLKFYEDADSTVRQISIPGRLFNVEKHYIMQDSDTEYLRKIAQAISDGKNVLAFRPGKKEINETIEGLQFYLKGSGEQAVILPMHGELPIEEQNKAFEKYSLPKVVVATNIAQTSITIPDINVVVDDGVEKRIEVEDGIENLVLHHISQADVLQRAGRAGRVSEGEYYLCSPYGFERREEYSDAEINRLLLDKVVLKLYSVGIDAEEIEFYHQPSVESLVEAKKLLELLDAIDDNGITELGKSLIQYPVSVRSSKIIETAKQYNIVDDILKIVAIIENRSLINFRQQVPCNKDFPDWTRPVRYSDFTNETRSDLLAELAILDKILNYEIEDITAAGINKKSFFRIKDFYEKLRNNVDYDAAVDYESSVKDGDFYKNFLKCLYAGNPDRIFLREYSDQYQGLTYRHKFSRNSCIEDRTNVVLAYPRCITYKDRWGCERQMLLIDNISTIAKEDVLDIIDRTKLTTTEEPSYSTYTKSLHVTTYFRYMDKLTLDHKETVIERTHPDFSAYWKKLVEKYPWYAEEEKKEEEIYSRHSYSDEREGVSLGALLHNRIREEDSIEIEGRNFRVHKYYDSYRVEFSFENEIPLSSGERKSADGNDILFVYGSFSASSCELLREKISNERRDSENRRMLNQRKMKKITDLKSFESDYMDKLGQFHLYNADGSDRCLWYGLAIENDEVKSYRFDSKEDFDSNLLPSLQKLFRSWIYENYATSKFSFLKYGKRVTNKSTEESKSIFQDYAKDIVANLTLDNLVESKEYVGQVFEECISLMEENPW